MDGIRKTFNLVLPWFEGSNLQRWEVLWVAERKLAQLSLRALDFSFKRKGSCCNYAASVEILELRSRAALLPVLLMQPRISHVSLH